MANLTFFMRSWLNVLAIGRAVATKRARRLMADVLLTIAAILALILFLGTLVMYRISDRLEG